MRRLEIVTAPETELPVGEQESRLEILRFLGGLLRFKEVSTEREER